MRGLYFQKEGKEIRIMKSTFLSILCKCEIINDHIMLIEKKIRNKASKLINAATNMGRNSVSNNQRVNFISKLTPLLNYSA